MPTNDNESERASNELDRLREDVREMVAADDRQRAAEAEAIAAARRLARLTGHASPEHPLKTRTAGRS